MQFIILSQRSHSTANEHAHLLRLETDEAFVVDVMKERHKKKMEK